MLLRSAIPTLLCLCDGLYFLFLKPVAPFSCFVFSAHRSDKAELMAILGNNKLPSDVVDGLIAWKSS